MSGRYNRETHHRRSVRIKGYDYSQPGAYFITICSWQRESVFGEIVDGAMELNECGKIVQHEWFCSSVIRHEIELDVFVIMPNHIHGIIFINNTGRDNAVVGANGLSPLRMKPKSISSFMAGFKSAVTKQINISRGTEGRPVWQRNYYEHVIRNEKELFKIRKYIEYNPLRWSEDKDHPDNFEQ